MSKFKLTQTATEVQDILNNSLQKPTGLAKTKLVGVGVNGQENIEIGDNLTLANGKLSATGGGDQIHGYRIIGNNTFHYNVYTTKNYNFQIGKVNEISDFKTNDNYKELRAVGTYPAAGYFENDLYKLILNTLQIRDDFYAYNFNGYDLKNTESTSVILDRSSIRFFYVVQLF